MKINVYTKVVSTKAGKKFNTYFTKMILDGEQHWVTVKFRKEVAIPPMPTQLECLDDQVNAPFHYAITTDNNGNKTYPEVWIRGYVKATQIPRPDTSKPLFVIPETDDVGAEETEIECDF